MNTHPTHPARTALVAIAFGWHRNPQTGNEFHAAVLAELEDLESRGLVKVEHRGGGASPLAWTTGEGERYIASMGLRTRAHLAEARALW